MSWPVLWGRVQAPPNAAAGAPRRTASALTAAQQRFGPARVKDLPPNASSYAILRRPSATTEWKRQLFRRVKHKYV